MNSLAKELRSEGKIGSEVCIVTHTHDKGVDTYICLTESDRIELATRIIKHPESWKEKERELDLDFSWAPVYNPTTQTSQWEDYQ
jgi:hypothetical protein